MKLYLQRNTKRDPITIDRTSTIATNGMIYVDMWGSPSSCTGNKSKHLYFIKQMYVYYSN